MSKKLLSIFSYAAGIVILAIVLPSARNVWGSFAAFGVIGDAHGFIPAAVYLLVRNLIVALPFGILFGVLVHQYSLRNAVLFGMFAAAPNLALSIWLNSYIDASWRHWWLPPTDFVLFVATFTVISNVAFRIVPSPSPRERALGGTAFCLIAILCYAGPYLYL
jgi:hypothetical protein